MNTQDETVPTSELVLYRTDDAQTRIQVRLDGQAVWLTQRQMAVSGHEVSDHFVGVNKMVDLGSGSQREVDDIMLTREPDLVLG
ncbi:hypothetical protein [Luteimonas salinisoli]|uniref:hypothetical protein n=1 Tax=Luteimonas salinisoli TaxID=2752307 RepID=UPI001C5CB93A|nr:hypothetical protein [Luteimonas salinisoli]